MNVRARTILTVTSGFLAVCLAILALDQGIVRPAFVVIERSQALEDGARARAALDGELRQLELRVADWAEWDDAYAFMHSGDPAFIRSNIGQWATLEASTHLNLLVFLTTSGHLRYSGGHAANLGGAILPRALLAGDPPALWFYFAADFAAALDARDRRRCSGWLPTEHGLLMVAAHPVVTTLGEGPARGILLFGRYLDPALQRTLVEQTQVGWTLLPLDAAALSDEESALWPRLEPNDRVFHRGPGNTGFVYELLTDLGGEPLALLRTPMRHDISQTARRTSQVLMGSLGLAALILVLAGASLTSRFQRMQSGGADALAWSATTLVVLIGFTLAGGMLWALRRDGAEVESGLLLLPVLSIMVTLMLARYIYVLILRGRQAQVLTARQTAELTRRDALLTATADALAGLLSGRDPHSGIGGALGCLGQTLGADRAYLFEYRAATPNGEPRMTQRYLWCASGVASTADPDEDPDPDRQALPRAELMPRWYALLTRGASVKGLVQSFPDAERAILEPLGIRSILLLPIMLHDGFWGFVGFDDCHRERVWDESEETLLRTATAALGQTYVRQQAETARHASEQRFRDLTALASDWFWEQDARLRFTFFSFGGGEGILVNGLDAGQLLGKTLWEWPLDWASEHARLYSDAIGSRQPFRDLEYCLHAPDGEDRWFSLNGQPLFDTEGGFLGYRGTSRDISERKRAESRIQHLAFFDALTALPNRALLAERADLALAMAARHRMSLALLFIDLDRFKEVNDALGHDEGDALLLQVATRLKGLLRAEDTVARLGGDEFVLMLPEADEAGALSLANKVLDAFRQPFLVAGHLVRVTMSVGIALYPQDGQDFGTLLRNADAALYRAKDEGRDTCAFYAPELTAATLDRLVLEGELRQALADEQLIAYFQPKVRLSDGRLVGAEALVRWRHPRQGLILPGRFIPAAESTELILGIGDWMLDAVCRQLAGWRQAGLPLTTIAVNLCARHFQRPQLVERVRALLETYDLPPRLLELELTESTLLGIEQPTIETLRGLERLGIGLAIDDFGTGYSSLSYLKQLPLTALKIDRSFVRDLETDADDRAIAATIVALGRHLELTVVAEGVENEQQRQILLEQGCDLAQGYLFDRPTPAADFASLWLASNRLPDAQAAPPP